MKRDQEFDRVLLVWVERTHTYMCMCIYTFYSRVCVASPSLRHVAIVFLLRLLL